MGVQAWNTQVAAGLLKRVLEEIEGVSPVALFIIEPIGTQLGSASSGVVDDNDKCEYFARKLATAAIAQQRDIVAGDVGVDDYCLEIVDDRLFDGAAVAVRSAASTQVIGAVVLLGLPNAEAVEVLRYYITATDGITVG